MSVGIRLQMTAIDTCIVVEVLTVQGSRVTGGFIRGLRIVGSGSIRGSNNSTYSSNIYYNIYISVYIYKYHVPNVCVWVCV